MGVFMLNVDFSSGNAFKCGLFRRGNVESLKKLVCNRNCFTLLNGDGVYISFETMYVKPRKLGKSYVKKKYVAIRIIKNLKSVLT